MKFYAVVFKLRNNIHTFGALKQVLYLKILNVFRAIKVLQTNL